MQTKFRGEKDGGSRHAATFGVVPTMFLRVLTSNRKGVFLPLRGTETQIERVVQGICD